MDKKLEWLSDNQLMDQVKGGDLEQLGLLFERYKRPLYQYFFNVSRDQVYAEDAVQMVFERIIKYKHRFRGEGDFKAWLFHIARNIFYDHVGKKKYYVDDLDDWKDRVSYQDDPGDKMAKKDDLRVLEKAMMHLPDEKREILVMSKIKGMRYKVIAETMNCTEGAVKVKVFRALSELKKVYFQIEKSQPHGFTGN